MGPSYGPSISNSWDHRKLGGVITLCKQRSSWANIIIIRLEWKAGAGRACGGEGDPEEKLRAANFWPFICLSVPTLLPPLWVSPTSQWHKHGGGGGRSQRHSHSSARDKAYDENDTSEWQTDKQGDKTTERAYVEQLHQEVEQSLEINF